MRLFKHFLLVCLSYGSLFAQNADLIGRWQTYDGEEKLLFILNSNGSGSFDGIAFTYVVEGKQLVATYDYGVFHYEYELKNGSLSLSDGNLEHPYVFTKAQETPKTTSKVLDKNLMGTWSNKHHQVTFYYNGSMVADGKKYLFDTQNGKLKLYLENQMEENPYSLLKNKLNMVLDGKVVQLTQVAQNTTLAESMAEERTDALDPKLAGKWCLVSNPQGVATITNECMILTADGSYIYFTETKTANDIPNLNISDKGLWKATSTSLILTSDTDGEEKRTLERSKHHSLHYIMLVIDGRKFVSGDKKTTW